MSFATFSFLSGGIDGNDISRRFHVVADIRRAVREMRDVEAGARFFGEVLGMIVRARLSFGLFLLFAAATVAGCGSGSVSSSSSLPVAGGSLTGSVTASGTISSDVRAQAGVRALFNVSGASIWLQDHPEIRATTAADGSFVLENVPFGTNRVVANLKTRDNKTFKTRSEPIEVSPEAPAQEVGQLSVEFANNRARIILRDSAGRLVPNAILTLWGEVCELDANGAYLSPPLPDSELLEEILVTFAGGLSTGVVVAPFTPNGEAAVVTTLTEPGAKNQAPNAWLTSHKEPADKINPGEVVKLWAILLDGNTEDLNRLTQAWRTTGGTLASGSAAFPEDLKRRIPNVDLTKAVIVPVEWTAPDAPGTYKIEVSITDPAGLDGLAQHPLNVHLTDATPVPPPPANRPPAVFIEANSTVQAGEPLALAVRTSDPDLDLLTFAWSVSPAGGEFYGAETATWTAPAATGAYELNCRVTEIRDQPLSVTATFTIFVLDHPIIVRPGMIAGHVLDEKTRLPIARAVVAISGTSVYTITDDAGYFQFVNLTPGSYDLIATRNGYQVRTYPGIIVPAS